MQMLNVSKIYSTAGTNFSDFRACLLSFFLLLLLKSFQPPHLETGDVERTSTELRHAANQCSLMLSSFTRQLLSFSWMCLLRWRHCSGD